MKPVPNLNERLPFMEHWALCVLPSGSDAVPSDPSAREAFLNADYFDLGVSRHSIFRMVSGSDSYMSFIHSSPKREPAAIMDISSALEIGSTGRSNDWILERAHFLVHNWGTYRPILWNCQHFAVFIAQITVATEESASIISRIMSSRREFVFNKRIQRHVGCMVGLGASSFVPVVGPALALGFWATARIRMATDYMKDTQIASQWKTFLGKCEELHQIWFR